MGCSKYITKQSFGSHNTAGGSRECTGRSFCWTWTDLRGKVFCDGRQDGLCLWVWQIVEVRWRYTNRGFDDHSDVAPGRGTCVGDWTISISRERTTVQVSRKMQAEERNNRVWAVMSGCSAQFNTNYFTKWHQNREVNRSINCSNVQGRPANRAIFKC